MKRGVEKVYDYILVAVDGSPTSEHALGEAIRIARATGATLHIVNVVDERTINFDSWPAQFEAVWQAIVDAGSALLRDAAATAGKAGVRCDTKLIELDKLGHRVAETIAKEAEAWRADLIVVGTHGRRGLSHLFVGSVAEGIVRVATKPVLLIRSVKPDRTAGS